MASLSDEADRDLVPISALEHYVYCPRQCALIHVEQTFTDNVFTLRGRRSHERVDTAGQVRRPGLRTLYAVPLWSDRLGLSGRADCVEFDADGTPYPVEHKVGRRRRWAHDDVQLCAQALCLEEMTGRPVPRGAVFYHASQARREVDCDARLRALVEETTRAVRALLAGARLPPPVEDARCDDCSLAGACLPGVIGHPARERAWRAELYRLTPDGLLVAGDRPAARGERA
jgi:CRISPR-associated exonuclease Cas4